MSRPGRPIVQERRHYRPVCEGLESRALCTASSGAVSVHLVPTPNPSFAPPDTPVKTVYHEPLVPTGGVAALESSAQLIQASYVQIPTLQYSTDLPGKDSYDIQPFTPTVTELERENFVAKYEGRYTIGPGRFSDEAYTIHLVSRTGGTNQSTRGLAQLELFEPNTAFAASAGYTPLVQGIGTNFPYNTLNSASNLIVDVTGDPTDGKTFGQYVLPTQVTWYEDPTGSGGYTPAFNQNAGAGVIDLVWYPDKTPRPGTLGSGRVVWLYQGLVNTSGILSATDPATAS